MRFFHERKRAFGRGPEARGNPPGNANFSERVPEWFLKNREPKFVVLSSFGKSSLVKLALSLVIAAFPLISGCTTIMSVSVSEIHPNNQTIISADDFGTGIFRLTTPDLHVMDKLRRQCFHGEAARLWNNHRRKDVPVCGEILGLQLLQVLQHHVQSHWILLWRRNLPCEFRRFPRIRLQQGQRGHVPKQALLLE